MGHRRFAFHGYRIDVRGGRAFSASTTNVLDAVPEGSYVVEEPKVGLRTQAPNEARHLDVRVLRLLDGTKAYVHAVIDNFSRRIPAWTVASHLDPMSTHAVLRKAARQLAGPSSADVVIDSGVENRNGTVADLFDTTALRRVIAQIDVSFSNSPIEAWWRTLKHQWLYLHSLDNLATLKKLVAFPFFVASGLQRLAFWVLGAGRGHGCGQPGLGGRCTCRAARHLAHLVQAPECCVAVLQSEPQLLVAISSSRA